jgi:hypothetical protein
VFGDALPPPAVAAHRAISGDFNGDEAVDLAVPARVEDGRAGLLSSPLANWIVQDASSPRMGPEPHPSTVPVTLSRGDTVLAIVHGLGARGWRDPEARQGYLVKVGGALRFRRAASPSSSGARPLLGLRGDILREASGPRFLYWTGSRYAWHPRAASGPARVE